MVTTQLTPTPGDFSTQFVQGLSGAIDWNVFGAGLSLIFISLLIYMFGGVVRRIVKTDEEVPSIIPLLVFITGIVFILQSLGIGTELFNKLIQGVNGSGMGIIGLGLFTMIMGVYMDSIFKVTIRSIFKFMLFLFGNLLILEGAGLLGLFSVFSESYKTLVIILVTVAVYVIVWKFGVVRGGGKK